jgi:indole-3-glycerol phosphate synthase
MKKNILMSIVEKKLDELQMKKELYPVAWLRKSIYYDSPCLSLQKYVKRPDKAGIIAEFKRKSPSSGWMNPYLSAREVTLGYMQAGASALSVLTDHSFFGGSEEDLKEARKVNFCPVLRKDFIIDEYQIEESKSLGADAILLIAGILNREQIRTFTDQAHQLGMEVLFEVHSFREFEEKYIPEVDLVGINARNLENMEISLETSIDILNRIRSTHITFIAESGIQSAEDYFLLKESGFDGFLIGSYFMKQPNPAQACRKFVHEVQGTSLGSFEKSIILGI